MSNNHGGHQQLTIIQPQNGLKIMINPSMDPATGRRKNTSFKITNILPTSRPASNLDAEESEDDNEAATLRPDLQNIYNQIIAQTASPVARGRFQVLPNMEVTASTLMTTATAGVLSYLPNPNRCHIFTAKERNGILPTWP